MKRSIVSRCKAAIVFMIACLSLVGCSKETATSNSSRSPEPTAVKPDNQSSAVATDWYRLQCRILLERNSALNGVYFGYIGIGLYEAVRPGIKHAVSFSSKLYQMPAMPVPENNGYSWPVSANAAMASMVRSFYTGLTAANRASIDSLEAAYKISLVDDTSSAVFARSQAFGRSVAAAIRSWYLTDNLNASNVGYTLPAPFPGSWQPTPTANVPIPVNPFISSARTYLEEHLTATVPAFPLAYDETPGSPFYEMVKEVYDTKIALTNEQKAIANFWVDQGNGVGYTPPGHDFMFVTQALEQSGANLALAAEAYAKGGIAERDATIVCFRAKYENFLLRPVTYIRKTAMDVNWLPFIIATPPHPEYPAAHAFITGAVMEAVAAVIGDDHTVVDHSYDFRGFAPRTFTTIFGAGEDAGISRLYGGIHYRISINEGLAQAKIIGGNIGAIQLK